MAAERHLAGSVTGPAQPVNGYGGGSGQAPRSPALYATIPHHQRAPSLGEIQQQGEEEQEAQFNRLRNLVRLEQERQAALATDPELAHAVLTSPPSSSLRDVFSESPPGSRYDPSSPSSAGRASRAPRSPMQRPTSLSRHSSRSTQPLSTARSHDEGAAGGVREEGAFYQAMKQMILRENEMLRERIKSLEKAISDIDVPQTEGNNNVA